MRINNKEQKGNLVSIEVEASEEQFAASLEKTIKEAGKTIKIPGFRPGKVPRHMLKQHLNMQMVEDQASHELISDLYPDIIKETGIEPVDYPAIEAVEKKTDGILAFKIKVEVYPEVKLGKYKGIKAEQKSTEVTEDEVVKFIENLRDRFAKVVAVADRGIQDRDLVDLDLKTLVEEKEFASLTRKGLKIQIGLGSIDPEFDQQIIGLLVGEMKNFGLDLKKDYPVAEVAGKKVLFEVKINKISQKEVELLNDEFAKKVSRFSTLAEFKEEMKTNLTKEKEIAVETEIKDALIAELTKGLNVEIPEALIKREIEGMLNDFERSISQSGLNLDGYLRSTKKTKEDLTAEMREGATSRVLAKLGLRAVAEQEKIEISEEEIDNELKRFAEEAGKTFEEFKATLQDSARDYIVDYLQRQKALDFIKNNAKISLSKESKMLF